MKADVLLITATFDSGQTPFTKLDNIRERTEKHMEGLLAWLADAHFGKIVLARNCATPVDARVLAELGREYGKEIEFLDCPASEMTAQRGKGYGEGEIVRHALGHSRFLRGSDSFYKITGKLYCPRMDPYFAAGMANQFFLAPDIRIKRWPRRIISKLYRSESAGCLLAWMRRRAGVPVRLISGSSVRGIDTRMYRVEKKFYEKHLLFSHRRVHDFCHYYLEDAFFDDLRHAPLQLIEQAPVLMGTSGTTSIASEDYAAGLKERAREVARRLLAPGA
jgi:hypothetical protein